MKRLYSVFFVTVAALVLGACTAAPNESVSQEVTRVVEVSREVEVTRQIEVTRLVELEVTREIPVTRVLVATPTPPPTVVPDATPTPPKAEDAIAFNYLGQVSTGPLTIEVARVLFVQREVLETWMADEDWQYEEQFWATMGDSPVIGELILRITNNGDSLVSLWPLYRGAVSVNGEQIRLEDFRYARLLDELDEEFLPGATAIGGLYFGVDRTPLSEITSFGYYTLQAPFDPDTYADLGPTVSVTADLTHHIWEPWPDDL